MLVCIYVCVLYKEKAPNDRSMYVTLTVAIVVQCPQKNESVTINIQERTSTYRQQYYLSVISFLSILFVLLLFKVIHNYTLSINSFTS